MAKISPASLRDELSAYCRDLLLIKRRLYSLRAIEAKLTEHVDKQTGTFKAANHQIYEMANDVYSMLVIDLCSFCKHFGEDGGFIRRLNNHLGNVSSTKPQEIGVRKARFLNRDIQPERLAALQALDEAEEQHRLAQIRIKAANALFSEARQTNGEGDPGGCGAIRERFTKAVKPVETDRNVFKAHRFENDSRKKAPKNTPLPLGEIEKAFTVVEDLLGQLWMLTELASYEFKTDLGGNTDQTAQDVVDLIIHRNVNNLVAAVGIPEALKAANAPLTYYWEFRERIT